MYLLIVYDMEIERVNNMHKFLKKYLSWIQNSVFEGEVGLADYFAIKKGIKKIIDKEKDSVLIFKFRDKHVFEKEVIGAEKNPVTNIV